MKVSLYEPQGRNAHTTLYSYRADKDLLQLSNDIIYRLNGNKTMNTPAFNRFMRDFEAFEAGEITNIEIEKANIFLGKLGLPDEIASTQKESLWVL
jgi:5'-3' exonuclease